MGMGMGVLVCKSVCILQGPNPFWIRFTDISEGSRIKDTGLLSNLQCCMLQLWAACTVCVCVCVCVGVCVCVWCCVWCVVVCFFWCVWVCVCVSVPGSLKFLSYTAFF